MSDTQHYVPIPTLSCETDADLHLGILSSVSQKIALPLAYEAAPRSSSSSSSPIMFLTVLALCIGVLYFLLKSFRNTKSERSTMGRRSMTLAVSILILWLIAHRVQTSESEILLLPPTPTQLQNPLVPVKSTLTDTSSEIFPPKVEFIHPSAMTTRQKILNRQYRCVRPLIHYVEASNTFPVIGPLLRDIGEKHGKRAAYIDIGSNDGQEVALYMKMLHKCSQCHIVSVEPNINYTKDIRQKVEANWNARGPAVTLCRGAVTNERNPHADSEELYLVGEGVFAHIVPKVEAMKHKYRQRVPNVRLSRVIEKMQFDRVVAVKVDTEGYDGTILWSLLGLWSRIRPDFFIYEINSMVTRFPTHPSTLAESFNSIGYKSFVGGLWVDPTQLRMPLSDQQPAMLLFEMTPERWVAVTEAFRFEAGILLPEGGYVLSNFTHITSKSSQEEINILHRILHSRKSGFCRRMEVTEWDVWIHTPWLEMKLEGRLRTFRNSKRKQKHS